MIAAAPTAVGAPATTPTGTIASNFDLPDERRARAKGSDPFAGSAKASPAAEAAQSPMMRGAGGSAAGAGAGLSARGAADSTPATANDELATARTIRDSNGCRDALAPFDRAIQRGTGTPAGWDALLEAALCRRQVGNLSTARFYLNQLLNVDSHKDRARQELDRLDQQIAQAQGNTGPAAVAGRAAPRAAAPSRAATAPAAAAPPPATAADKADNASGF